jgi:hypothetical protein
LFLELSDESVEIIDTKSAKYVIFLGVRICVSPCLYASRGRPSERIDLEAPIHYIRGKLTEAGFLKDQKPVPKLI